MTPQQIELALETIALVLEDLKKTQEKQQSTITAIKQALADHAIREVQRLGQEIEQGPVAWRNAAIRVGEDLSSVGPDGYYDMTAQQWLDWAMEQQPHGKNSLAQPEQEPAGWEVGVVDGVVTRRLAPPQRKPLSAEQVDKICAEWTDKNGNTGYSGRRQIVRAIEAAHGIKENK